MAETSGLPDFLPKGFALRYPNCFPDLNIRTWKLIGGDEHTFQHYQARYHPKSSSSRSSPRVHGNQNYLCTFNQITFPKSKRPLLNHQDFEEGSETLLRNTLKIAHEIGSTPETFPPIIFPRYTLHDHGGSHPNEESRLETGGQECYILDTEIYACPSSFHVDSDSLPTSHSIFHEQYRYQSIVVFGRNGSGKSHLVSELREKLMDSSTIVFHDDRQFRDFLPSFSAQSRYLSAPVKSVPRASTEPLEVAEFSRTLNLLETKANPPNFGPFEDCVTIWEETFQKILFPAVMNGKITIRVQLLPSETGKNIDYDPFSLSCGERELLTFLVRIHQASRNTLVVVDEPEKHLHQSLVDLFWNRMENLRPDCLFLYCTHDIEFGLHRKHSKHLLLKETDFSKGHPEFYLNTIPSDKVIAPLLASISSPLRESLLLIEGNPGSLDERIYPYIFPNFRVISYGSCSAIHHAIIEANQLPAAIKPSDITLLGLIDRDDFTHISDLDRMGIYHLKLREVEVFFMIDELLNFILELHSDSIPDSEDTIRRYREKKNKCLQNSIPLKSAKYSKSPAVSCKKMLRQVSNRLEITDEDKEITLRVLTQLEGFNKPLTPVSVDDWEGYKPLKEEKHDCSILIPLLLSSIPGFEYYQFDHFLSDIILGLRKPVLSDSLHGALVRFIPPELLRKSNLQFSYANQSSSSSCSSSSSLN